MNVAIVGAGGMGMDNAEQLGSENIVMASAGKVEPTLDGWKKSKAFPTEAQYIPHPATWLNAERWNDQHQLTLDQVDRVMSDEERERTKQEAQQWMLDFRKKQQSNQS